jgi:hypothetical protein
VTPQTKIAGLPAWAWGLVLLGGVGVGLYLRKRAKGSATTMGVPSSGSVLGAASGGGSSGTDAGAGGLTMSALDPYLARQAPVVYNVASSPAASSTAGSPSPPASALRQSVETPTDGSSYVVAPYYSPQGQAEGAGPTPVAGTPEEFGLVGTLQGAGFGSHLSIL